MDFIKALVLALDDHEREYIHCDGYGISYNALTDTGSETAIVVYGWAVDDNGSPTDEPKNKYYILKGDHRKAYHKVGKANLPECMAYFRRHDALISPWSD